MNGGIIMDKSPLINIPERISDPDRLGALYATSLLDSLPEHSFDRITDLVTKLLNVPVALVSLVDVDRQFFKSSIGLPEPWNSKRETPLTHSFCQHVVARDAPLIVADASFHHLVWDNLAIRDLNVISYLGVPVHTPDGQSIGSLCAIDGLPRGWTQSDIDIINELVALLNSEIHLRQLAKKLKHTNEDLERTVRERTQELEHANHELNIALKRAEALVAERDDVIRQLKIALNNECVLAQERDEAQSESALMSRFLANMSHEIRTPMNGVIGMASLLQDTSLDEEQNEYVQVINQSGSHLLMVIDDILDYSKIEAGQFELSKKVFSLYGVIEGIFCSLRHLVDNRPVTLSYKIDSQVPDEVWGDEMRLRQVLINLLGNALKFTQSGAIVTRIEKKEELTSPSGNKCVILQYSVTDTGIGIPVEKQDKLFGKFSQVDASTSRQYGGTGLGLAICKGLVELMGGTIGVESKPGTGSTFSFTTRLGLMPSNTNARATEMNLAG